MIDIGREIPTDPQLRKEFIRLSQTVTSAMSFESVTEFIDIPEGVNGLTILDVGGGGSDFTATLLEKGADAYAVDYLYASRSDLKGKAKKNIDDLRKKKAPWAITQERALERCIESMKRNPSHYMAVSATELPFPDNFFNLVVSTSCIVPYLDLDREAFFTAVSECIRVTKP